MGRKKKLLPVWEHVTIEDVAAEGMALARVEGRVVFVPFAVPGDVADLRVRRMKSRYAEAEVSIADSVPLAVADVLFDPQTSGGLLFSVHPDDADALEDALRAASPAVPAVQRIGAVGEYEGGSRVIVR